MSEILDRVTSSPLTIVTAALIVVLGVVLLYLLLRAMSRDSSALGQTVAYAWRYTIKEIVGGPDVAPYERINGFLIAGLLFVALILLLLIAAQSVKALVFGGGEVSAMLVASLLIAIVLAVGSGLTCVRFCGRQRDDVAAAKRHGN